MLVDGAILDVSNFSHRHPGGARLILNAVGTDITNELLGEELSVGHAMSFTPHRHPEVDFGFPSSEAGSCGKRAFYQCALHVSYLRAGLVRVWIDC